MARTVRRSCPISHRHCPSCRQTDAPTASRCARGFGIRRAHQSARRTSDAASSVRSRSTSTPPSCSARSTVLTTCARRKASCDLSGSVVTDPEAVTIRLARPDSDLPFKLALPLAFPVPAATPMTDQRLKPVPSTGPYVVTSAGATASGCTQQRLRGVVRLGPARRLRRRRHMAVRRELGDAFDRLDAGTLDWMASRPLPNDLASLQAAHPDRIAFSTASGTTFVGYDVLRPPFDDVRVRQALNYAIDRAHVVELAGGAAGWRATCQIFPPNLEGYVPFCPYTLGPRCEACGQRPTSRARRSWSRRPTQSGRR